MMLRYGKLFIKRNIFLPKHECPCSAFSSLSLNENSVFLRKNFRFNKLLYRSIRDSIKENDSQFPENQRKILKIAIVGVPNAGKSTLINQIIGRHIFATSCKVHTTRCRARAVMVLENTQLVFLDTPGIVGTREGAKHHLEESCLVDSEKAIGEADIIGVLHDVSNPHTIFKLDPKVLQHLILHPLKRSFLVLNKIDAMKKKRDLLDCVKHLTKGYGIFEEWSKEEVISRAFHLDESGLNKLTESELQNMLIDQTGWPYFEKVFMISALNGSGVGDIQIYLMDQAKNGEWLFEGTTITDQDEKEVVKTTVFSKLLDNLPNVVPYNLEIHLEYFNKKNDGSVSVVVLIIAKNPQIENLVKGKGGSRIQNIARGVEQGLRSFFLNDVHVRLILKNKIDTAKARMKELNAAATN